MSKKRGKEEMSSGLDDCRCLCRWEGGRQEPGVRGQARRHSAGRKTKPLFGSRQVLGECVSNKYYLK